MVFGAILQRFVEKAPLTVMAAGALERVLASKALDELFGQVAERQYEHELLFSTLVDVMSQVVCRMHESVHAAFQRQREEIPTSVNALYDKLHGVEPATSRALVRHTATHAAETIRRMGKRQRPWLPGYRVRVLDGNHLEGTEHRLKVLRGTNAGALPGMALVLLDPQTKVLEDVIPCEDAHTQECRLLDEVLERVAAKDVIVADRHFSTSDFLFGLAHRKAYFVIRQHMGHLRWETAGRRRYVGMSDSGRVYEQEIQLTHPQTGATLRVRRITVKLLQQTRDKDTELHVLTNLPQSVADGRRVARIYRGRWSLETAFQELTVHLRCELNTLGYPRAALFGFCVAAACANLLAIVKGALRAVHGAAVDEQISNYYISEELSGTYRGMKIAVPEKEWTIWHTMSLAAFARTLCGIARAANLSYYQKHPRGPKKPPPKRPSAEGQHLATARLLNKTKLASKPRRGPD
jgi:Transposase DDE domain